LIDTNIFLHAANSASPDHTAAREFLQSHFKARTAWATTWPILYEFLRVATHPRVFPKPLKSPQALAFVQQIAEADDVTMLSATPRHAETLATLLAELSRPAGNLFHDIHTATIMREHGVPEIITADTDFLQFRSLRVTNPLLTP
jgi:toxin-antitoxin system PIN domain toxin